MKTILTLAISLLLGFTVFSQETVVIGTQEWMLKNLNVGTIIMGTSDATDNTIIEKYCYNNLEENCDIYGGLYQWNEAMNYSIIEGSQGICPTGFHIPTKDEWNTLFTFLGGIYEAGGKLKEVGTEHWRGLPTRPTPRNLYATNSSGFTALPGGIRWHQGEVFYNINVDGNYWTSTKENSVDVHSAGAMWSAKNATNSQFIKMEGLSIRCIKD